MKAETLVGLWESGPYDYGTMETSWLGFLPDGRGWSGWASFGGGMEVARFRWRCPEPALMELRYEHSFFGAWQANGNPGFTFASLDGQEPDNEVVLTGFTIGPDTTVLAEESFTALHLEKAVQFCSTFALARREISIHDDPVHAIAPWGPPDL
ncbi:hypothetical protein [Streptosporangium lutulentum]|uniref:Uncharacterized protein n=1 Tax=Streptosporangium lutulentum TaxID=1461250 RepID=A0ABT9Q4H2_9ACTN|nr:hypothetical protein [Streptosporangium lutulentum]MDP9841597.1 hypothetical protein [Streptosporangium lutulentum]